MNFHSMKDLMGWSRGWSCAEAAYGSMVGPGRVVAKVSYVISTKRPLEAHML